MVRLLDHNVPVRVELNVETKFHEEAAPAQGNAFNVIGDLPGTDLANEIVLIGGHFDSWHGATGATDNATGCAAMMEVLRIIKTTGLRPRRTIRIAMWGAEEQGLLGSREYANKYLGTQDQPGPEHARHSAYFNLDNGTGRIRGIWMQQNEAVRPIFTEWIKPLKDLGVEILGPRSVASTDHTNIDRTGVPGFQFVQERLEYNSRTHHSNMDFYDRVQVEDLKQIATVAAVFAWQTANRDQLLPRKK
jgi:Zn-dependent M28 family amino/carboxypeptidase